MRASLSFAEGYTSPLNYYVSVETQKNPATKLTQLVLARFIGDKHDVNRCSPPGGEKVSKIVIIIN